MARKLDPQVKHVLEREQLIQIVEHTPLVSIDLAIPGPSRSLLMGYRVNEPAANTWMVPGGRICKNETLDEAFGRISEAELGRRYNLDQAMLLAPFTHIYDTNFARVDGIGTHYVCLAYQLITEVDLKDLPDAQHSDYRWVTSREESLPVHHHSQVYFDYMRWPL